jgi:hypothetical protein
MSRLVVIALVIAALASGAYAQTPQADPEPPAAPTETVPPPPPTPAPPPPPPPTDLAPKAVTPAPVVAAPIRVAVQCEEVGRTKACPAFLLGIVDAHKVLLNSPRAGADVTVYATANEVALVDRLHLRFVGKMTGAPSAIELDVDLDTRATDDEQRAQLEPAFLEGISLFVRARHPSAVKVELSTPEGIGNAAAAVTSPWGVMLNISGNGNYTNKYRSAQTEIALVGRYVKKRFRALAGEFTDAGINRQPPLMLDDGTVVSLDSHNWAFRGGAEVIKLFNDTWSVGFGSYTNFEDPKSQYRYNSRNRAAVEWDMFPADDPRGNRLAVFYHLGWAIERYNIRNEIGERFAQYPLHGIDAVGSVRHDKISYGLQLSSDVQVNHPGRRHLVTASPFVTVQLGTHVDLNLSFSITQRELPGPDPNEIDPSDYAQLSRLSYAEPLSINGSIGLQIHWDPTNGVRNDRLESI